MILWKPCACCPTCSAECSGSDGDMGTSMVSLSTGSEFNSTPGSLEHVSRPFNNRERAPETSDSVVLIAGEQTSSARCGLGSNLSATNVLCRFVLYTSPVQHCSCESSKNNGTWSVRHSEFHGDVKRFMRRGHTARRTAVQNHFPRCDVVVKSKTRGMAT